MTKSTQSPIDMLDPAHVTTYQSGIMQSKTYRSLNAHFSVCLKPHNLTPTQWFIIGAIYDVGTDGIRMTELATKIGSTLPTLTETVTMLELKGWVVKKNHAHDGRSRILVLEPRRRTECQEIEEDLRAQLRTSIYSKISREELTTYIRVLYKLVNL